MALNKAIFEGVVQTRRNESRIAIASPADFVCTMKPLHGDVSGALPYCFDFVQRRAIYVGSADNRAVQDAPFYYLHLRRTAERVLSVPVGHGPLSNGPLSNGPGLGDPVFLFSPGRVGSTLISRVLAEAGVTSVSEPDFYTQLAHPLFRLLPRALRMPFETAMWNLSRDLSAALGDVPVIKLRAECARVPELFVRRPDAKTMVLFRGFESWSRSTAQVFGAGPRKAVGKYLAALRCYEILNRRSNCHLMRYEDWVNEPETAADALGQFLGAAIAPEAVRRALASHSQEGTPLIRRERPDWQEKWQGAMALWRSPRLATARARLEIPPVWD